MNKPTYIKTIEKLSIQKQTVITYSRTLKTTINRNCLEITAVSNLMSVKRNPSFVL